MEQTHAFGCSPGKSASPAAHRSTREKQRYGRCTHLQFPRSYQTHQMRCPCSHYLSKEFFFFFSKLIRLVTRESIVLPYSNRAFLHQTNALCSSTLEVEEKRIWVLARQNVARVFQSAYEIPFESF